MRWQELDYYATTIIKCRNSFFFHSLNTTHTYFNAKFLLHFKLFSYHEVGFMKNVSTRHLYVRFVVREMGYSNSYSTSVIFCQSQVNHVVIRIHLKCCHPEPKKGSSDQNMSSSACKSFCNSNFVTDSQRMLVRPNFTIFK